MTSRRFHFWATVAWITIGLALSLLYPDSVPWVNFMSLWANVIGHWSAYQAARAEREAGDDDTGQGWVTFHLVAALVWLTLGSFLTWEFAHSVQWLILMSLWANVVGHWSAYQATRAEDAT